jgi:hypothetical protein
MRLFTEGFEMQDLSSDMYGGSVVAGPTCTIDTGQKRSGNASLHTRHGGAFYVHYLSTPAASTYTDLYVRFAVRLSVQTCHFAILNTTDTYLLTDTGGYLARINFTPNAVAVLQCNGLSANTTTSFTADTWYLVELHLIISDIGGAFECRVNGGPIEAACYGDTKGTYSVANAIKIYGYSSQSTPADAWWDDIAVNSVYGAVDNGWCGNGSIIGILPDSAPIGELLNSNGDSDDNNLFVDEVPEDGDTTYVESETADQEDLYGFAASGLSPGLEMQRVWIEARARDTQASGRECAMTMKPSGGSVIVGSDDLLLSTYQRVIGDSNYVNPFTGNAWTVEDIDALEAGFRVR